MNKRRTVILRALALTLVIVGAVSATGCATNPATGRTSFVYMSWSEEQKIGAEAAPQFTEEFGGRTPSSDAQRYVNEIGAKLTGAAIEQSFAQVPDLEWEYILLDSSVINAFALPGGKVFVSRGLAEKLDNEAQLAGVIGHEIGHVMARHGNQRITKQIGFNLAIGAAAIAVGVADDDSEIRKYGRFAVPAMAIGGNVVLLSYGRDEELEADQLGMQYMTANGYDPAGQRQVMLVLKQASQGGSAPPEWLSTHPASDTRIRRIDKLLTSSLAFTQNNPDYGLYADAYQRRMLDKLNRLPPAQHGGTGEQASLGIVSTPHLWCAHCQRGESATE